MSRHDRADLAKERAIALAAMVRDESPDSIARWLRGMSDTDRIDLLIVLGAAMPQTTKGFQAAWAWTEQLAAGVDEKAVFQARSNGYRDVDIARALACQVEDLPPRMKVA